MTKRSQQIHASTLTRSNLGRLYFELTDDMEAAICVFTEALKGAEDVNYNNYWLGVIWARRGNKKKALLHLKKAPAMLKRRGQEADWIGARKILVYELIKAQRRDEALKLLNELKNESPTMNTSNKRSQT